jgi:hypothetical protein
MLYSGIHKANPFFKIAAVQKTSRRSPLSSIPRSSWLVFRSFSAVFVILAIALLYSRARAGLPQFNAPQLGEVLVDENIIENTSWTRNNTYIVRKASFGIAQGVTLTIQAGTVVKLDPGVVMDVFGTLVANGADGSPVRFVEHDTTAWGGINYNDSAVDAALDGDQNYHSGNLLRWVTITGAAQGIQCTNVTPFLEHITVNEGGVNCALGDTPLHVSDSQVIGDINAWGDTLTKGFWEARASLPDGRSYLGAAALNGKIYAFGGENNNSYYSSSHLTVC